MNMTGYIQHMTTTNNTSIAGSAGVCPASALDPLHAWLAAWDAPAALAHLVNAAMNGEEWAIARLDGAAAVHVVLRKFRAQAADGTGLTDQWCAAAIAALGDIDTSRPDGAIARA